MKNLKKIGALLLALMMVLGMATVAMADAFDKTTNAGAIRNSDAAGMSSIVYKVYFNDKKPATVTRPKTDFTYNLATVAGNATNGINEGVAAWLTLATNTTTDAWDLNAKTAVSDDITITVNTATIVDDVVSNKTKGPGIYRYSITQTAMDTDQQTLGIQAVGSDGNKTSAAVTKYLDIFVTSAGAVSGAVLYDYTGADITAYAPTITTSGSPAETIANYNIPNDSTKTDGFYNELGDNTPPDNDDTTNDETIGYKVTIKKEVAGNMPETGYLFPFTLTLTTPSELTDDSVEGMVVKVTGTDGKTELGTPADVTLVAESNAKTLKIMADGTVTLNGLTKNMAIAVRETIDAELGYTITSTIDGTATTLNDTIDAGTATTKTISDADVAIVYTNTRNVISPTGVVLRTAPYVLMLGATPLFVLLGKKRKATDDEE